MRRRPHVRSLRAALPAAALIVLVGLASGASAGGAPATSAAKKKTATLKDGRYTFKDPRGRKNTMVVSGGGKKVRFTIAHFGGGAPGQFPYCQAAVVDHGSYKLKADYVVKTERAFTDGDLYTRKAPAIETDGSAGGGMSANGTIDPKKLILNAQFQIRLQDVAGGIFTCFEAATFSDTKLVRAKK